MSVVMFLVGAIAAIIGLVLVAAGIPVKEFSFGNTLILSGTVALVGGLIVFALGAVIAQLQRISDMLGTRPATRNARSLEPFEASGTRLGQGPGRIPFPSKPKTAQAEPGDAEPPPHQRDEARDDAAELFAPALRNPAEPGLAEAETDETPLMPRQTPPLTTRAMPDFPEPARSASPPGVNGSGAAAERASPFGTGWRPPAPLRPVQPNYFDAMWPSDQPSAKPANADDKSARVEPSRELPMRETVMRELAEPKRAEPAKSPASPPGSDLRAVPILKSGVIDGMGYTLYVDGSIEAELPHGTLRFASIGELREHLEKSA
jgi:hypothetical protein